MSSIPRLCIWTAAALVPSFACGGGNEADPNVHTPTHLVGVNDVSAPDASIDAGADTDSSVAAGNKNAAKIGRALARVSRARHLSLLKPVKGRVMERPELIAWVKDRVTKEVPPDAIVNEGRVLAILGFLPVDYDYLGGTLSLLDAQLAGLYEPDDGTMYIAADLEGEMADTTLDHELTHALQDQHYDLKSRTKYVPGQSDHQEALAMLSEGDAMSAMVDVLFARQKRKETALDLPDDVFRSQAAEMNTGKAANTPEVMKESLVAPYIDGTLFVQALRREGGWDLVDTAWTNPPISTEQILHVDKWKSHEAPLAIEPPPPPAIAIAGVDGPGAAAAWQVAETDIYGELEIRIVLAQWADPATAASLARGWGGDRGVLYTRGDENAFALHVKQDPGVKLDGLALIASIEGKLGAPTTKAKGLLCYERADRGPLAIRVSGGELAIVAGGTHVTVTADSPPVTTMRSYATCPATIAWAKRIFP